MDEDIAGADGQGAEVCHITGHGEGMTVFRAGSAAGRDAEVIGGHVFGADSHACEVPEISKGHVALVNLSHLFPRAQDEKPRPVGIVLKAGFEGVLCRGGHTFGLISNDAHIFWSPYSRERMRKAPLGLSRTGLCVVWWECSGYFLLAQRSLWNILKAFKRLPQKSSAILSVSI